MRAVVVGGGVAGPATAVGLRRAGIEVTVLERHPGGDDDTGSYLTLAPNGLAALDALGVRGPVCRAGFASRANAMHGATGRLLGTLSLGPPLEDGAVGVTLRRARLAAELAAHAVRAGATVRRGAEVVSVRRAGDQAVVGLADGSELAADVVVGADGVHSRVRRLLDPRAPRARYVGLTNFGGVTAASPLAGTLTPGTWHFVFGHASFFGAHPTPDGDVVWFVNVPEPAIDDATRRATDDAAWRERLVALAAPDAGPAAELVAAGRLELAADNTHDLARVPVWHDDRVVIVGDAAHAPAPSSGQGASMALEDAVVLARALRDAPDVAAALTAYERSRRARVERIVAVGARTSSAKIPGPVGRRLQEAGMRFAFRHVVTEARTAWMSGHRERWTDGADTSGPQRS